MNRRGFGLSFSCDKTMMNTCPVVRIVWHANAEYGGFVEINESDFDPKIHTLFVEDQQAVEPKRRGRKPKEKAE